jgi:hypothetical protein
MLTTFDVLSKYKARLNKSDSEDYDNLWIYQVEETFNKGILEVVRRLKRGKNQLQEGDEETRDRIDDLQIILIDKRISVGQYPIFVETQIFPDDYLYYKRITPIVSKNNCNNIRIKSHLKEEANVDDLLIDWDTQPSFDFEETFNTLLGNKARIYHNEDFRITEAILTYYKQPRFITFNRTNPKNLEFKDDISELMIDEGVKIMAGDINSWDQKNTSQERGINNE